MAMKELEPLIDPEQVPSADFSFLPTTRYSGALKNDVSCSHAASKRIFDEGCSQLGLTGYQVGRLLDTAYRHKYRDWATGSKRMAQSYMARFCKLLIMGSAGVDLMLVDWIDWDLGEIHWKEVEDGKRSNNWNHVSNSGSHVLPAARKNRGGLAQLPSEPPWANGARP